MSGISRRIDELGRIVIPKEIRKSLRIHEGDNIEILEINDEVILRKKSVLNKISDISQNLVDSIYSIFKIDVFITDRDYVIAATQNYKKTYLNKELSKNMQTSIERRENIVENYKKDISIVDGKTINGMYIIKPIIVNGDVLGLIILFSNEEKLNDYYHNISKMALHFLEKYLEEWIFVCYNKTNLYVLKERVYRCF